MRMKESETLEFKKSTSELKEAIISISAILNKHQKGEVIFGVGKDGNVLGQHIGEETLRDISKAISDHIEPKIYPEIKEEMIEGKSCIKIEFSGNNAPYFAYGRAYKRIADEDKPLSAKELEKLILDKNKEQLRWDYEACKEAKAADISSNKLERFLKESGRKLDDMKNSLNKLGLIKGQHPVNAAIILFGKNPGKFFQNATLRCAVFGTKDTSVPIDMQDFEGDLFRLIEEAEKYFLKNIHIGMRVEGLKRIDIPEINKEAFREAIINAFCHRDYWKPGSVDVAIFKGRVEIRSPGLLYGGLTIEKIRTEPVSERRNETIAKVFREVHYVEMWGRGIGKILKLEPATEFKEAGTHFITTFRRKTALEETTRKGTRKVPEKYQKIIELIAQNPQISRKEISITLKLSEETIQSRLRKMTKTGIIKRIGPDKGGHWKIVQKLKSHRKAYK
jgi:ATP-dependent DNA helicase RecG